MKYVALLSGGKDSCYNLIHCAQNCHELIAAASLRPEDGKEDLDSYLYQTVGQDAIEFVAQALEVPLYRKVITGGAVEQGAEYGGRMAETSGGIEGDETEDLYTLLSIVKTHHPDVQGVSVGAILSNYQRVRVEHVCRRLNLTSLAYLWQRDQAELLSEMIEAGMEAIIIKVAGIGLQPKHLGKTLAQMQPTLTLLNERYGSHVCGEGGEYESLTLDCPLFKKKIVLTETETVIHSDSDFATVAFLRVKNAILKEKNVPYSDASTPPLLEEDLVELQQAIEAVDVLPSESGMSRQSDASEACYLLPQVSQHGVCWTVIGGIERPVESNSQTKIEDEVRACFGHVKGELAKHSMELHDIAFITVLLSDMSLFPAVNAIYSTFFGTSPPARACVAVDLPSSVRVRLEVIACKDDTLEGSSKRQALHVQGLSYWAPANIGPYSQAVRVDERVFISGQIGLIPSSMTFPSPPSLAKETAFCFQHARRITSVLSANTGGDWEGHSQLVLYWMAQSAEIPRVRAACQAYIKENDVPTLFLAVKSLPRGALVEKQVVLHTGRVLSQDEDDDAPSWIYREPDTSAEVYTSVQSDQTASWHTSAFPKSRTTILCMKLNGTCLDPYLIDRLRAKAPISPLSARVFHVGPWAPVYASTLQSTLGQMSATAYTAIPCRAISTLAGDNWDVAVCITSD